MRSLVQITTMWYDTRTDNLYTADMSGLVRMIPLITGALACVRAAYVRACAPRMCVRAAAAAAAAAQLAFASSHIEWALFLFVHA